MREIIKQDVIDSAKNRLVEIAYEICKHPDINIKLGRVVKAKNLVLFLRVVESTDSLLESTETSHLLQGLISNYKQD